MAHAHREDGRMLDRGFWRSSGKPLPSLTPISVDWWQAGAGHVRLPHTSHRRSRMRAVRPTNVRDSRTRLRFPLNSAQDIPAPPRSAEGALGPYLRAIRSHRMLVILVTLAAIAAAVAWTVLRTPSYSATAEMLVTPVAQEDQTFLGLPVLRDSGDPTRSVQTAANQIHSSAAAVRTADEARRRLDPQQGPGSDRGHPRGREQHPRRSRPRRTPRESRPVWPTPSSTRRWRPGARC